MKKSIILSFLIYFFSVVFIIFVVPFLSDKLANISLVHSSTLYEVYHDTNTDNKSTDFSKTETTNYGVTEYLDEGKEIETPFIQKIKTTKPLVSIVIDDYGYFVDNTVISSLSSDMPITVAIIPFQDHSKEIFSLAKKYDKEVIVHMPMEALNHKLNVEPYISSRMSDGEIIELLDKAFREIDGVGLNNHMGSLATSDERVMNVLLKYLSSRGKIFLDSFTTVRSVASKVAKQKGLSILVRDVFIDNSSSEYYILSQLDKVASVAYKKGYCVAIGHIKPNTINILLRWYQENKENFNFVTLSQMEKSISQLQ